MGADVTLVTTFNDGLDIAKRRPFDVIIADQGLPDGLGIDLLKQVSEARPFAGQVLYTVRDDYGLQNACQSLGATYLIKPASRAGLGEAVKAAGSQLSKYELEGPKRLLIAEDTLTIQDTLKRQLDLLGVAADFVDDGRQALEAMHSGQYGILITDLHMPEVDGYQVINEIRQSDEMKSKHTPVIVLTADVQMAQRNAYLVHGFDECLLKPVSLGQFRRLLMRWGVLEESYEKEEAENISSPSTDFSDEDSTIIDLKAMEKQMGAVNKDTLAMVGMFVDMTTPLIEKIRTHYDSGDHIALSEAAHSLKGGARSACCMALGDTAEKLQDEAAKRAECGDLVDKIEKDFAAIKPSLNKITKT